MKLNQLAFAFLLAASTATSIAAQDIIKVKSNGTSKTKQTGGVGSVTGSVTKIDAYARVGSLPPAQATKTKLPYDGVFPDSVGQVKVAGTKFTTTAKTIINVTTRSNYASWDSNGSYANVQDNGAKATETYEARSFVKDPMLITLLPGSKQVSFELDLGTSMSLMASPTIAADETWSASISGSADTTLNGLGDLWSWSWAVDSKDPTDAIFSFESNPLLGLDDAAIDAQFNSLATYDPQTGLHSLSSPFSISIDESVLPGQSSYEFGGDQTIDVQGGATDTPEPGSLTLLLLGTGLVGAGRWRRTRNRSKQARLSATFADTL